MAHFVNSILLKPMQTKSIRNRLHQPNVTPAACLDMMELKWKDMTCMLKGTCINYSPSLSFIVEILSLQSTSSKLIAWLFRFAQELGKSKIVMYTYIYHRFTSFKYEINQVICMEYLPTFAIDFSALHGSVNIQIVPWKKYGKIRFDEKTMAASEAPKLPKKTLE